MTWWRRRSFPTTVFVSDFRIALKCFMSLGDLASIQGGLKYNCRLCPKSQKYLWEVWRINIQRCMYLETWKPGNKPVLETQDEMDLRSQHFHLQWISETVHWGFAEVNEGEKPDENKTLVKDLQWTPILDIREDIFCEHPECQRCNVSGPLLLWTSSTVERSETRSNSIWKISPFGLFCVCRKISNTKWFDQTSQLLPKEEACLDW